MRFKHLSTSILAFISVVGVLATAPASADPIPGCVPLYQAIYSQYLGQGTSTYNTPAQGPVCSRFHATYRIYHDVRNCGYPDITACDKTPISTTLGDCGNYDPCANH